MQELAESVAASIDADRCELTAAVSDDAVDADRIGLGGQRHADEAACDTEGTPGRGQDGRAAR